MSTLVLSLPISLILLVHLHILDYPHANKPEYDHDIFNPRVRGLRDRIKLMEDIFYFLVGRIEGKNKDSAKTILPTYPCLQPSDTVAFRTSLAKYLEILRHQSLFPSSKVVATGKGKGKEPVGKDAGAVAWWWKDVVVRKSLLEECSGERFERLLLSVSTHALLKRTTTVIEPENKNSVHQSLPAKYSTLLSEYQAARKAWSRSASLLLKRQENLELLRAHIVSQAGATTSKYTALSTERLVSLVDSKLHDLHHYWSTPDALQFLTELAGLTLQPYSISHAEIGNTKSLSASQLSASVPLPIAAAHHPSNLKRIAKPIFSSNVTKTQVTEKANPLRDRLDAEERMQQALASALARASKVGDELAERRKTLDLDAGVAVKLDLWSAQSQEIIDFEIQPTPELLGSLSLDTQESDETLEKKIDHIRESVLPQYPPIADAFIVEPPVVEALPKMASKSLLPQRVKGPVVPNPSHSLPSPPRTPEPAPHLYTSTPPATVKPPSVMESQRRNETRKSIRSSMALARRPSLFADDEAEDEVQRIVHGTEDRSTDDVLSAMTPKPKVTRILTGTQSSTVKRPKQSFPMVFEEPPVALPSLVSSSSSFSDLLQDTTSGEWSVDEVVDESDVRLDGEDGEDDDSYHEAPSMTLRDILLRADTTQFDLLDDHDDLADESFDWE